MLAVEIGEHKGAPALFVNGEVHAGLMFWIPDVVSGEGMSCVAGMRDAGVHLISAPLSLGACITSSGEYDFSRFDAQMESLIKTDPDVLAMPRLDLTPLDDWLNEHPEERMVHFDLTGSHSSNRGGGIVSFSSLKWRALMQPALRALIAHAEARYGENIMGYHVGGGDCGEWSYMWADCLSDYSIPQQNAFRQWLREKYDGHAELLRRAWCDADVSFDAAAMPLNRARAANEDNLLDPIKDRRISDYLVFHSEAVAEALVEFCGVAKAAVREAGRSKIIASFYGYHFWFSRFACGYHNSGHHALQKVLACPDVDMLCAPGNYHDRHPGGMFTSQLIAGSVRLHGKLFYNEDDTRTCATPEDSGWGRCADLRSTLGVLCRNLVGTAATGGTTWWMDQGVGWFNDSGILKGLAELRRLAESLLASDRSPSAEIAVIVSQESAQYMRYDGALTEAALNMQLSELGALGAPFDLFDAADLAHLFSGPDAGNYRAVIFLNCLYLTPDERRAIRDLVARDGRTLVWSYAAGLITETGISTEAMSELTGIRVKSYDRAWPLEVVSFYGGDRHVYGTSEPVAPLLNGDDPDARVCGFVRQHTHKDPDMPGLLDKDCGDWRSVWSAAPTLPAVLLREISRDAGVHIYSDCGDQVLAPKGWLAVHAAFDGERRIQLPAYATLEDFLTGETITVGASESASDGHQSTNPFTVMMRRGDTRIWKVRSEACD